MEILYEIILFAFYILLCLFCIHQIKTEIILITIEVIQISIEVIQISIELFK